MNISFLKLWHTTCFHFYSYGKNEADNIEEFAKDVYRLSSAQIRRAII
ncbi:MAG: hypothetical protein ACR2IA_02245 [Pyrinomonadaceae bacterium]